MSYFIFHTHFNVTYYILHAHLIAILPFLERYYEDVAGVLLPQLWKLTYITIKVMSESGIKCLLSLSAHLPISLLVASINEAVQVCEFFVRMYVCMCVYIFIYTNMHLLHT